MKIKKVVVMNKKTTRRLDITMVRRTHKHYDIQFIHETDNKPDLIKHGILLLDANFAIINFAKLP